MRTHIMQRLAGILLAVILAFTPGCKTLTPTSTELAGVHEAYRKDFAQALVPLNSDKAPSADFSSTLKAIAEYKAKHPDAGKAGAHLTVLQGMIHLQAGDIGQAWGMIREVSAASEQLRGQGGRHTRDGLFAAAFPHLVRGWAEAIGPRDNNTTMKSAGDEIGALLRDFGRGHGADADEGALYLSACAAAFRLPYISNTVPAEATTLARENMELIGSYLRPEEIAAARAGGFSTTTGRSRHLHWYRTMWIEAGRPQS